MNKKAAFILGTFVLGTFAFSQDFDDWGSSDYSEPQVTVTGSVETNARAYVDQEDSQEEKLDVQDWLVEGNASGKLGIEYSGSSTDVSVSLKFDKNSLGSYKEDILDEFTARAYLGNFQLEAGKMRVVWGKGDKLHVLDNFNANDYTDYIIPEYIDRRIAEPMFRVVYSTPSNVKFEAVYTPVMTPDRLASSGVWVPKAAETLTGTVTSAATSGLALAVENLENARLEAAEASTLSALAAQENTEAKAALQDLVSSAADAGKISYTNEEVVAYCSANGLNISNTDDQTKAVKAILSSKYSDYVEGNLTSANTLYTYALSNASSLASDSSVLYPDTKTLEYGQAGLRTTFTLGGFDLGLSYYYGHNKQPSFNAAKFSAGMNEYLAKGSISKENKFLSYDRLQVFGLEGAFVLFSLNSRFEVAYNLTEDIDGDDPYVHNNSIAWVAGFDRDIPLHNLNFNIQTQGKFILGGDEIEKNGSLDVDNDGKNCHSNNKIVVDITDTWNYEKIKLDVMAIWGIERSDLIVKPSLSYNIKDGFTVTASGMYIYCKDENSEFDGWQNNSFAQIGMKCAF